MQIKLDLIISVILESVKAETFIKGAIDRSSAENASALAYHETAGDEKVHERKLMRGIYTSLDKLKGTLVDYLENDGASVGDNAVSATINETTDTITIILNVTSRFNTSFTDSLARLASKFIEDNTLIYWWGAVGNQVQLQFYTALLADDTASIHRLFTKKASKGVAIPYTSKIEFQGTEFSMLPHEECTLSYIIDDDVIDDIDVKVKGRAAKVVRKPDGFHAYALTPGITHVMFYSVHDETINAEIHIIVHQDGSITPPPPHVIHM